MMHVTGTSHPGWDVAPSQPQVGLWRAKTQTKAPARRFYPIVASPAKGYVSGLGNP